MKISQCDCCEKKFKEHIELWYIKHWWDKKRLLPQFLCKKCSDKEYKENMKNIKNVGELRDETQKET